MLVINTYISNSNENLVNVVFSTWPCVRVCEGEGDVPLCHPALVDGHAVVVPLVSGPHVGDRQREVPLYTTWT